MTSTSNTNINKSPYLVGQRNFPNDSPQTLSVELDRAYVDIAKNVNARTIGIFPNNRPITSGESWILEGGNLRRQGLRQVYQFTVAGNLPHQLDFLSIYAFTKCSGSFTDGTNWYGAIFASNVAIAGQVSFYITPTNIVILSGGGAPAITAGYIILEWISNV